MLHTFEARIPVTLEQDQLLAAHAAQWSRAMRQAWVLLKLGGLSKAQAYSLCFGSNKLLRQRHTEHNSDTTPFATLPAWQAHWGSARDGQWWWSVGHTDKPSGNNEGQWLTEAGQRISTTPARAARARRTPSVERLMP